MAAVAGGARGRRLPRRSRPGWCSRWSRSRCSAPDGAGWAAAALRRLAGAGPARAAAGRGAAVLAIFAVAVAVVAPIQVARGVREPARSSTTPPINALARLLLRRGLRCALPRRRRRSSRCSRAARWAGRPRRARDPRRGVRARRWPPGRRLDRAGGSSSSRSPPGCSSRRGAILVRYRVVDELPYQVYKGLISGGAVLAGLAVIGLAARGRRPRPRASGLVGLGVRRGRLDPGDQPDPRGVGRPGHRVPGGRRRDGPGARRPAAGLDRAGGGRRAGRALVPVPDDGRLLRRPRPGADGDRARQHGLLSHRRRACPSGAPPGPGPTCSQPRRAGRRSDRARLWTNGAYALSAAPTVST